MQKHLGKFGDRLYVKVIILIKVSIEMYYIITQFVELQDDIECCGTAQSLQID